MERREEAESRRRRAARRARTRLDAERAERSAARTRRSREIDAETATHDAERDALVATSRPTCSTLYEKVRATAGGVGAAALRQRRCEGCRLELAGTELTAVRDAAPDEVLRCEECRRILVRTAESGL